MTRTPRADWLIRHQERAGAALNLFCFPHAGAGASVFRRWSPQLPEDIQVLGVQLPGRENRLREPSLGNLQEIADRATEALRPLAMEKPCALYGHSMGSLLAFEVARRLRSDANVVHVFVSGHNAPHWLPRRQGPASWDDAALLAELRRLGGTEGTLLDHPEFRQMFLPIFRVDYQACVRYECQPGPRLRCPITAFVGAQDPDTHPDGARAWAEQTAADFEMLLLPGDHFFPLSQEEMILRMVASRLAVG